MTQKVVVVPTAASWEPNVPQAVLISNDLGHSALALAAHPDDADQRCVVFVWEGVEHASMSNPNDEARSGHELFDKGLSDIRGLGVVEESELIARLERQNSAHPFHQPEWYAEMQHFILPLKETTVEVVAGVFTLVRISGATSSAAAAAMSTLPEPAEPRI